MSKRQPLQESIFGAPEEVLPPELPDVERDEREAAQIEDVPSPEPYVDGDTLLLFDVRPTWALEWRGMPEFAQEDLTPTRSLIVHFESEEDARKFEEVVRQPIGPLVRSIWFPEAEICRMADKRYADENA